VPSPTITTLSHATGEASVSQAPSESDLGLEAIQPRRWPLLLALGAVAAAAALFFVFRPAAGSPPPASVSTGHPAPQNATAPSAPSEATRTVLAHIQSSPPGASVLDEKDRSVLGTTPLHKSFPQGGGSVGMTLRLAGYKDKSIAITLDGNSSTAVDLERMEPAAAEATPKPAAAHAEPRKAGGTRKPPKTQHNEEDEWLVH
jgi:hypothetical protein